MPAEPHVAYVDTHLHFWDLQNSNLHYSWLQPGAVHPQLSPDELGRLGSANYSLADFLADAEGTGLVAAVHVQAAVGIEDPVEETAWLQATADAAGFAMAIVGHADLASADLHQTLDRHQSHDRFRGVRDFVGSPGYLEDPAWRRGFAELGRRGLIASIDCTPATMADVDALLRAESGTRAVIDHMGFPQSHGDEEFALWTRGMTALAAHEQVICKVSEMGIVETGWSLDSIDRWVTSCVDLFGPARVVFGTNWPVDKLYGEYAELVGAYRTLIADYSRDEQAAMLGGNALELYSIPTTKADSP